MMKKVLFGVAMALLASVSVGTLQSCKDDVSDLKTQTSFDLAKLEQDLATAKGNLQEQITANKNSITKTLQLLGDYAKIEYVERRLSELNQDIKNKLTALENHDNQHYIELKNELGGAFGRINALEQNQIAILSQISSALNDISWLKNKVNNQETSIGNLSAAFSSLQTRVAELEETIKGCVKDKDFQDLVGRVEANEAAIDLINDAINGLRSDLVDINNQIGDINNQLGANSESIENLKYKMMLLKKEVSQLKEELNDVKNDVNTLKTDLNNLTIKVDNLSKALDDLTNQVDQLVTGILIQGVHSPVFGDFSLPIGVKSNIIFNWYGFNKGQKPISFPSSSDTFNARGDLNIDPAVGIDNISNPEIIPAGSYYPAADTLGIVYVTLNPQGSKFSDTPVKVVNSLGEPLPFEVTLKPSTNKLMHGYTRAIGEEGCINNGLYEGAVVLDPRTDKDRQEIEVTVDEQLATSMKNALRDPSKSTAVALMKALYDQFNGKLPAYALNYGWNVAMSDPEVSPKAYSVLSQYDLAVATAKPLSYTTLVSYNGSSKHLPIIDDIDNIIYDLKDKVKIEIEPLKEGDINIDLSRIEVTVDTKGVNLVMVIPDIAVISETNEVTNTYNLILTSQNLPEGVNKDNLTGNDAGKKFVEDLLGKNYAANYKTQEYHYEHIDGLDGLAGAIESGVQQGLTSAGTEITNNIREQINKNIIAKINSELKTQIDNVIEDLGDQFQPFFNKANRAFDLYNKIARKVNKFLKDPNAYFQVTALYSKGNDDYGFVSGSPTRPSVYKGNSDFSIFLTSYTGELIVPAYKKYVAITGKVEGGKVVPYNVNTSGLNSGDLNKVLDGNRIRVTVPAQKLAKGVYEFTYQALDYQGYTSTRKFYINIDK